MPLTGGIRTSGQANFYPQHVDLPKENMADEVRQLAHDLTAALLKLRRQAQPGQDKHIDTL